ncbi:glutamate formimidoyltransferase [Thermotoga neapolitana]|uniref:glutamate formimidoyltransferase n=1 Tax=Thermotoga neapolitana (strain ATCC 49049 / DSM 4359 / NBRC 107923 / NS-E) TaxID=309803 RepID=B9KAC5_THENN|nr:glutamate formimidoyltransferase [Thermotoga neapolitana]ACM23908.1 Formiminotransferase- cyclodeaminase/formiminotetrahydrofolate cyclodeaminase [Thermotoga neapolitana DSM 4359]KFZ21014.1 glutamate formiminotransferase [Thermotoga neapolitana LA10]HBF10677.1 glutamate formimidoyltransferase [Thermotoga neapolitana]
MKLVESVPNFSEGRRKEVVEKIVAEAKKYDRVWVLDWSMDADHNRSVVTLVGEPENLINALFDMTKKAVELIDLRNHTGQHPRMGAADVIPLVPLYNVTMDECVQYSKILGKRIGEELGVPVYLYEKSATHPERENLANIRRGEFEGFFEKIKDPMWKPDFGPDRVHPSAGVTAVGAREFLIAFNVNLGTGDVRIAEKIAKAIRFSSGGLRYVKAIGIELKEKGIVQVSINITNHKKTPLYRVFEMIKMEAERYGVPVLSSEIVGLFPLDSLIQTVSYYLRTNLNSKKVIESNLLDILVKEAGK